MGKVAMVGHGDYGAGRNLVDPGCTRGKFASFFMKIAENGESTAVIPQGGHS